MEQKMDVAWKKHIAKGLLWLFGLFLAAYVLTLIALIIQRWGVYGKLIWYCLVAIWWFFCVRFIWLVIRTLLKQGTQGTENGGGRSGVQMD